MKLLLEIMMAGTTIAILIFLAILVKKIGRDPGPNDHDDTSSH